MASERKILGKGLSALISEIGVSFPDSGSVDGFVHKKREIEGEVEKVGNRGNSDIRLLSLQRIFPNASQPRKQFDEEHLIELADSIKKHGVIQPILVRVRGRDEKNRGVIAEKVGSTGTEERYIDSQGNISAGEVYEIIAGERRYRAARIAGLMEIPAIIKRIDDVDSFELAIIENIQRQNLTALEEASAYYKLMGEYAHTQESLSKAMGKSRSYIANTVRLLRLPEEVKEMLTSGVISAGHARAIINASDPVFVAKEIVRKNLNVRETESLVAKLGSVEKEIEKIGDMTSIGLGSDDTRSSNGRVRKKSEYLTSNDNDVDIMQIEETLRTILNSNVKLAINDKNECILTIKCSSFETIDAIISGLSNIKLGLF